MNSISEFCGPTKPLGGENASCCRRKLPVRPHPSGCICAARDDRGTWERLHGEGGIRTPDKAFRPYNGLANRRLQPLGHLSQLPRNNFTCGEQPNLAADQPTGERLRRRRLAGRASRSAGRPGAGLADSAKRSRARCSAPGPACSALADDLPAPLLHLPLLVVRNQQNTERVTTVLRHGTCRAT